MRTTEPIRTVLFGLGKMGRFHYTTLQKDSRFALVAVVNPVIQELPDNAENLPLLLDTGTLWAMSPQVAIVATPSPTHFELTKTLLERNLGVLVEKPAATTSGEVEELVALAANKGLPLAVGHVERCNPAVLALRGVLDSGILGRPVHIHAMRGGLAPSAGTHNHVILDLAVHELDVVGLLLGDIRLEHVAMHCTAGERIPDTAEIQLSSDAGTTASVHVNWLTPQKTRRLRVTATDGVCEIDYLNQTCKLWGRDLYQRESLLRGAFKRDPDEEFADSIDMLVHRRHSLEVQLDQFRRYFQGEDHMLCTGEHIVASVRLVDEIMATLQ